ncbi:MAG: hypothetical protein U5J83_12555 [Bryobacterales bacterium]|nr:hypothetical protein [Bryobacterales bacterium]
MPDGSGLYSEKEVLESWKEIAAYLDRDVSTVERWERHRGLPVRRIQGGKHGRVYAIKSELDAWKYQAPPFEERSGDTPANQIDRREAMRWALGSAAVALVVGIPLWRLITRSPDLPLRFSPLVNLPGNEVDPTFSPSGDYVAFAYRPENASNLDLYVKAVGSGDALRLTNTRDDERYPQWSPDSRQIVFVRRLGSAMSIWAMGPAGGGERKIADVRWQSTDGETTFAWSKTGEDLVVPDRTGDWEPLSLFALHLPSGTKTRLTSPPSGAVGDARPVFSPDGESLAFTRQNPSRVHDIWLIPRPGGAPKRITTDRRQISGLAWSSDGKDLVFVSDRGGPDPGIWRVAVGGGAPRPVAVLPAHSRMLALAWRTGRIAYTRFLVRSSIWRYEITSGKPTTPTPVRLIASGSIEAHPQYSPDGRAIAFMSDRSGYMEIWVCRADGTSPRKLTSLQGEGGAPHWSPDGKWIAFDMRVLGNQGIFLVGAEGGPVAPLILDPFENGSPSWSADGQWIWFTSKRSGKQEVWRVRPNGQSLSQLTHLGGGISFESPDGRVLYYSKLSKQPGIFKRDLPGGDEIPILPDLDHAYLGFWQVGPSGVYFLDWDRRSARTIPALKLLPHGGGQPFVVANLDPDVYRAGYAGGVTSWHPLAVSPDQRYLLITRLDHRQSNIMVAEGFR